MIEVLVTYDPQTGEMHFKAPLENTAIMDIVIAGLRRKVDETFFARLAEQQGRNIRVVRGLDEKQLREGKNQGRN